MNKTFKSGLLVTLLIAVGVAVKIFLLLQSSGFLVTNLLSDDAFYYFLLAKNVLADLGTSVDGINPANGFHPLWLIIILPIFKVLGTMSVPDIAPIYGILGLSIFLDVLVAVVIFKIVSRYTMNLWLRLASVALWLFNPFNIYEMLGGLETPLSMLFISLLILIGIKIRENPRIYLYAFAGIVGGLMMLSRLDNLFYFLFFLAWILLSQEDKKFNKIILTGVLASLVVLPWIVWNVSEFGTIVPASASSSTMVNHELVIQDNGPGIAQKLKAVVFFSYLGLNQVINQTGMPTIFLIILGLILGGWIFDRHLLSPGKLSNWPVELFLFFGFLTHFVVSASLRWTFRTWYFTAFSIFLSMLVAWFFARVSVKINYRKIFLAIFAVLILSSYFVAWSRNLRDSQVQQSEMVAAAEWSNENLPEGTIVGAFNSGVIGYFSRHAVVNLDGLVNNNAYEAMKERKLFDYIKEQGIEYIIDFEVYPTYRYRSFLGVEDPLEHLEVVENISLVSHNKSQSGINIYKVLD